MGTAAVKLGRVTVVTEKLVTVLRPTLVTEHSIEFGGTGATTTMNATTFFRAILENMVKREERFLRFTATNALTAIRFDHRVA